MTDEMDQQFAKSSKKVWTLYYLTVAVVIVLLVTMVAQDNEERLFYSLMTAAASYVFRPTDKMIAKWVKKLFGVERPPEPEEK